MLPQKRPRLSAEKSKTPTRIKFKKSPKKTSSRKSSRKPSAKKIDIEMNDEVLYNYGEEDDKEEEDQDQEDEDDFQDV